MKNPHLFLLLTILVCATAKLHIYPLANSTVLPDKKYEDITTNNGSKPIDTSDDYKDYPIDHPTDELTVKRGLNKQTQYSNTTVWGILTEPIKSTLKLEDNLSQTYQEYIPVSHVKFLEASGAKIVPISYRMEKSDLIELLDQLDGVYIHGDSLAAASNKRF